MNRAEKLVFWGFITPLMMVSYMNCGQFAADSKYSRSSTDNIQSDVDAQNFTVQSADQLARSMASVTGVEYVNSIVSEFNSRKSLMSTDYSLKSVNAPMMVSIANLGSQFCSELLKVESSKPTEERNFFVPVDFTKGVSELTDEGFNTVLDQLSFKFWGREITAEERAILFEAKNEFIQAIPTNNTNSSSQTRNLLLSTCTGMLASLDFILI